MNERAGTSAADAAWPATLTSAALMSQLVAGKATRDALFLTHFDVALLPGAMIGGALLSALSAFVMARAMTRAGPARVVPLAFGTSALLFVAEVWLSLESERAAAIVVYAHMAVFSTATGSAFWSLVNERFDPHEAKRLIGRIASGGTVGGVIGGLVVWRAASFLSTPKMLALLATMSVVGVWGSLRAGRGAGSDRQTATPPPFRWGRPGGNNAYLRDLAGLVTLGAIVQALLDWLLSQQASTRFGHDELLGFFALFNMTVGALSFTAQNTLTRRILERYGLGGTIKLQPVTIAAAIVGALLTPPLLIFHAVLFVRVTEGVTRSSLFRSAYELFYTPLPNAAKRATKAVIDVGFDRLGTTLGSGALLAIALIASPATQTRAVLLAVLVTSSLAWLLSGRLQNGYVEALAESLRSGAISLDNTGAEDLTTRKTLAETTAMLDRDKLLARIEGFERERAGERLLATVDGVDAPVSLASTSSLGDLVDPSDRIVTQCAVLRSKDNKAIKRVLATFTSAEAPLAAFVVPLLANDAVVRDAMRALRKIAPKVTGLLVDSLLDLTLDPRARRRIPRVLKIGSTERAVSGLMLALSDPVFDVRLQAGVALGQIVSSKGRDAVHIDPDAVLTIILRELSDGRSSWTEAAGEISSRVPSGDRAALGRGLFHVFGLLGLFLDREPLLIAYRVLRDEDESMRGTAIEYLEVLLDPRVKEQLLPLFGDVRRLDTVERPKAELVEVLLRSQTSAPR